MLALAPECVARAGAGSSVVVYFISITFGSINDSYVLWLFCNTPIRWVELLFFELATALIQSGLVLSEAWLLCVPWLVGNDLVAIKQIGMIGLAELNVPVCCFLKHLHYAASFL
jgi:hypothetical protein